MIITMKRLAFCTLLLCTVTVAAEAAFETTETTPRKLTKASKHSSKSQKSGGGGSHHGKGKKATHPKPEPVHKPMPKSPPEHKPEHPSKGGKLACFDCEVEAGALGSAFLASMWQEISNVENCDPIGIEKVINQFFTITATLQDSNGEFMATNRRELKDNHLASALEELCRNHMLVSWELKEVTTELPHVKDDFVWGGNMEATSLDGTTIPPAGYYFMIQLGVHNGGYTMNLHDDSVPSDLPQECYQGLIYAMVALDAFDSTPK